MPEKTVYEWSGSSSCEDCCGHRDGVKSTHLDALASPFDMASGRQATDASEVLPLTAIQQSLVSRPAASPPSLPSRRTTDPEPLHPSLSLQPLLATRPGQPAGRLTQSHICRTILPPYPSELLPWRRERGVRRLIGECPASPACAPGGGEPDRYGGAVRSSAASAPRRLLAVDRRQAACRRYPT